MNQPYGVSNNASTISYTTGFVLASGEGERPQKTPTELIASRAIETKDGWRGQIIMAGEIVYETDPQVDDDDADIEQGKNRALYLANNHIHAAFRRLIVGE